ncbi:MAG: hypothetical protein NW226_11690 [Microscillaceae bacterium]|nr:hypothetical protein [Microscillaceae bacterium]
MKLKFKPTALIVLGLCLMFSQHLFAQKIGEIKKKAEENKSNKSSSNSGGSNTNDDNNGSVGGAIVEGLFRIIFSGLFESNLTPEEKAALRAEREARRAVFKQERQLLRAERLLNREELRASGKLNRLYELNADFQYGGIPGLYQSYRPHARMRIGVISTDVRYNILAEERVGGRDVYETLDWQILQVAPVNFSQVSWRLGAGFMKEQLTQTFFPEFTTGLDFYFLNQTIRFAPELRVAYDFHRDAQISPRTELNAELSYALVNRPKFKMHFGVNGLYARYYEDVNVWTMGAGVRFQVY